MADDAKARGAKFLSSGEPAARKGYFYPASIVVDIDDNAQLVKEELFGPILPVLKFRDIDDALRRANDSPSGLGGSVWSYLTCRVATPPWTSIDVP